LEKFFITGIPQVLEPRPEMTSKLLTLEQVETIMEHNDRAILPISGDCMERAGIVDGGWVAVANGWYALRPEEGKTYDELRHGGQEDLWRGICFLGCRREASVGERPEQLPRPSGDRANDYRRQYRGSHADTGGDSGMKCCRGYWFYQGREYAALRDALIAAWRGKEAGI